MFTGIVKEVANIETVSRGSSLLKLAIRSATVFKDAQISDSISVNGVCLTLVSKDKGLLFFEAITSTLKDTNLKHIKKRDFVNLEPALSMGDKLGGHFVLGHVDKGLKVCRLIKRRDYWELEIDLPASFRKFTLVNGSVTIEGVSLTIKKISLKTFTVDIVPFTYNNTNLRYKKPGNWVNIEFDYLLKKQNQN